MTLKQLETEVLGLMFEEEFDSSSAFVASLNRAAAQISTERDRIESLSLYKYHLKPKEFFKKLHHKSGESLRFEFECKALCFAICGKGKVSFTENGVSRVLETSSEYSVIKEIINTGTVTLEFFGEFDYFIESLSVYDELYSDIPDDIVLYSSFREYDIKKIDPQFISFASFAKDMDGVNIDGSFTEGSVLKIPEEFEGTFKISYKRRCRRITAQDSDSELDIAPECEHLLPLLTAAYLLFEDNAALSAYYMSIYRDGMTAVKLYNRPKMENGYSDITGWAK